MRPSHDDAGTRRFTSQRLRNGAEEQALEARVIVRADHEEIGSEALRELQHLATRVAHGQVRNDLVSALPAKRADVRLEVVFCFCQGIGVRSRDAGARAIEPAHAKNVHEMHDGLGKRPDEPCRGGDDTWGFGGSIDGHEDHPKSIVRVLQRRRIGHVSRLYRVLR